MDWRLIETKLDSLHRCLTRIEQKCPKSAAALERDLDVQDIVALNLTRAVQICVDIGAHLIAGLDVPPPQTMGQTFDTLARAGYIDGAIASRLKKR